MILSSQQRITDEHWRNIEATLPATADRAHVRATLEQIARDKTPPGKLAAECEDRARTLDSAIAVLLKSGGDIGQLAQQSDAAKKQAKVYRSIGAVKRPHFLRHCRILWLWQSSGGQLGISTPRGNAPPHGPVIAFFQAAAAAALGKTPSPGQIKSIVSDWRNMNLTARWGGVMGGYIDDFKVWIIPAAKKA